MVLELLTDKHTQITSQLRYPLCQAKPNNIYLKFALEKHPINIGQQLCQQYVLQCIKLLDLVSFVYQPELFSPHEYRLLDSLVVECWHRVREVPGSIPSQGLRHTKDFIKWYQ